MIRALILATLASSAFAQSFEAASVKLSPLYDGHPIFSGCNGGPETADPGTFTCTNVAAFSFIRMAYNIPSYDISWNSPGPITVHLTAKIAPGTTKAQFRTMLQNLLAERFHLQVHWEKKDAQFYDLRVAKNGPKMKKSTSDPALAGPPVPVRMQLAADGFPQIPDNGQPMFIIMSGRARARSQTMGEVAERLSSQLATTVTDTTGLIDRYDFTLSWAERDTEDGLPFIGAIEQQLGLKLVAKKGQKDVLVIDHLDTKPTDN
jgi:uncharacterized protein (TIGR03435 family)